MNYYQLPLTSEPNQTFDTTIEFSDENKTFRILLVWNLCTSTWEISCWDKSTDEALFLNIPVIETDNLIPHLAYKEIGTIAVINDGGAGDRPAVDNLDTEWVITWVAE